MREQNSETVTKERTTREGGAASLKPLPRPTTASTKQMHRRLLRALNDRRIKRAFS